MEQTLGTLTIDRSKWLRGKRDGAGEQASSFLCDWQGHMCCLGFDAVARGCDPKALTGVPSPISAGRSVTRTFPDDYLQYVKSRARESIFGVAMSINDSTLFREELRESEVRAALINLGWSDVVFVDGPVNQ